MKVHVTLVPKRGGITQVSGHSKTAGTSIARLETHLTQIQAMLVQVVKRLNISAPGVPLEVHHLHTYAPPPPNLTIHHSAPSVVVHNNINAISNSASSAEARTPATQAVVNGTRRSQAGLKDRT